MNLYSLFVYIEHNGDESSKAYYSQCTDLSLLSACSKLCYGQLHRHTILLAHQIWQRWESAERHGSAPANI
jgi:hypothetical protein